MKNATISAIRNNVLLKNSNLLELNIWRNSGLLLTVGSGNTIYKEGDESDSIYLVINGKIGLIKRNKSGKPSSSAFSNYDFFGAKELFAGTKRCSMAFALEESTLFQITKKEIQRLTEEDDNILYNVQKGNKDFKFDRTLIDLDDERHMSYKNENLIFSEKEMNKILYFLILR